MLEAVEVHKEYPGVRALGGVSLQVRPGEIVALIGENGAGKSTLIRCLAGLERPSAGQVNVSAPVAVIWQELTSIPDLDVASNIFLGREPTRGMRIDRAQLRSEAAALLSRIGGSISPDAMMRDLSVANQQMVEIAKAISQDAKFVIMDEPTSSLSAGETATLLNIVRSLKESGVGVLYVSHRLSEIMEIADRVVALRDGQNAGELSADALSVDSMVQMMVGRELAAFASQPATQGPIRLAVEGLRTSAFPRETVSFSANGGEVLCIAGLVGAGRTEVLEAIAGARPPLAGTIEVDQQRIQTGSVRAALAAGLCLVPEDRRESGLLTDLSVADNFALPNLRGLLIDRAKNRDLAQGLSTKMAVKTATLDVRAKTLSGGNQQKIVIGKWLPHEPKVFLLDEPTRGIDVGSKAEIYDLIQQLTSEGMACVVVSSDMEEVLRLGDRILVMAEGRVAGELSRATATEEGILELATPIGSASL